MVRGPYRGGPAKGATVRHECRKFVPLWGGSLSLSFPAFMGVVARLRVQAFGTFWPIENLKTVEECGASVCRRPRGSSAP